MLLLAVILISLFVRSQLWGTDGIQRHWAGGIRHIAALIVGLCAFTIMYGMMLTLALLERSGFSLDAFINILRLSMVLFVAGYFLLAISLMFGNR